jgi:hypothetical protein
MTKLGEFRFTPDAFRTQLRDFRAWLSEHEDLYEATDIIPFLKQREQLAAAFSFCTTEVIVPDRIAFEFDLFGMFRCDLVIGDSARGTFLFIEFEDGRLDSIFKASGGRATRQWSDRFEHGYSQVIDWFWRLRTASAPDLQAQFGCVPSSYAGMLLIGRDKGLADETESARLDWRRNHVLVESRKVLCRTFDEMAADIEDRFGIRAQLALTEGGEAN